MMTSRSRRLVAALCLPFVAACGGGGSVEPADDAAPLGELRRAELSGDLAADRAQLVRLEERVRAIARTDGCAGGACDAIAVGAKACGGPRYYLAYCRTTTDVAALEATVAEIERFERLFNERYGVASTCDVVPRPDVVGSGGSCRLGP
jgi:hypothetical protein